MGGAWGTSHRYCFRLAAFVFVSAMVQRLGPAFYVDHLCAFRAGNVFRWEEVFEVNDVVKSTRRSP